MHRIAKMKDKLIQEAMSRMESMDGGSIEQMGQIVDMIKDLSEAEKYCMEADYYDTVVEAMDGEGDRYGYDGEPRSARTYVGKPGGGRRYGYQDDGDDRMGYRDSKGRYSTRSNRRRMRRGYSDESVENLRQMVQDADPERKKQLKKDLEELVDEM